MKYLIDFGALALLYIFVLFRRWRTRGIELLQPLISGSRSSDITDIITNVTGGVLGYGFYVMFKPVTFWVLDRLKTS